MIAVSLFDISPILRNFQSTDTAIFSKTSRAFCAKSTDNRVWFLPFRMELIATFAPVCKGAIIWSKQLARHGRFRIDGAIQLAFIDVLLAESLASVQRSKDQVSAGE